MLTIDTDTQQSSAHAAHFNSAVYTTNIFSKKSLILAKELTQGIFIESLL